jgi:hypothetical protein
MKNQMNKVNLKKEFFKVNLKEIREKIENQGIHAKWTMVAEAKEYKESLALENAFANNTFDQESWINSQLQNNNIDDEEV